jgi:hypothetical protein
LFVFSVLEIYLPQKIKRQILKQLIRIMYISVSLFSICTEALDGSKRAKYFECPWQIHKAILYRQLEEVERLSQDKSNLEILYGRGTLLPATPLMHALLDACRGYHEGRKISEQIAIVLLKAKANINAVLTENGKETCLFEYASGYGFHRKYLLDFFLNNNILLEEKNLEYLKKTDPSLVASYAFKKPLRQQRAVDIEDKPVGPGED